MIPDTERYKFAGKEYGFWPLSITSQPARATKLQFAETIDALQRAGNPRDIVVAARSATKALGFDTFTYGCIVPRIKSYPLMLVYTTMSREWMLKYHQLGYADKDPRIFHILNNSDALCWSLNDYRGHVELVDMLANMEREGLCAGATFPLHFHLNNMECAGMFSLNSSNPAFWKAHVGDKLEIVGKGHILANTLNKRLIDLRVIKHRKLGDEEPHPELLTPREREMLELMWRGDTDNCVAQQLFIEHTTVRRHIESVKAKLCAGSKAEMLSIAREMGICGGGLSAYMRVMGKRP